MYRKVSLIVLLCFFGIQMLAIPYSVIQNAGDAKDYPNSDYLVIFDSTDVDVKESGLSYRNVHQLIKVLTPNGAKKLNHITFNYDPLSAFVDVKKVKIYRKDGSTEVLGNDRISDYPAPARMIYWGARKKMADIGNLQVGDAIEIFYFRKGFTYALLQDETTPPDDSRYVPPMEGHFYDIIEFWNDQPVKKKVYKVKVPNTKTLYYETYNGQIYSSRYNLGEKTLYTFAKFNLGPVPREPHMVAISDVAPKLLITTTEKWEEKSLWFYNVNKDYDSFEITDELQKKTDEILQEARNEKDSIAKLTHWVADNIRYSGLSMGEGEGYTLHKSEMTFRDRCGVCKDKAGILVSMLRAAGFESYAAMTMARSNIEDIPADQFNHSITVVKLSNGEYKLLDPTWVPFTRELWSSLEQQQDYLLGVPEGADIMETPVSPPENHYFKMNGTSTLSEDGTLEGEFTVEAEGQSDGAIRGMFTRNFKRNWDMALERQIRQISPDIEILEMTYSEPYNYQNENMKIQVKYRIPNYAIVTANEIIFTPVVAKELFTSANYHLYFNPDMENRKYAFRDRCSRLIELKETIRLPNIEKAIYIPKASKIDGASATFEGGYSLEGNTLTLNEKIVLKKRKYEANEWENFRNVVKSQKTLANESVILKK